MAGSTGMRSENRKPVTSLRVELQRQIATGRCAYCRTPAGADGLTREHLIPRARGGARRDVRIIVPACAPCNRARGCRDLVIFLLGRSDRITCLLDHLGSLSPESIRAVDIRIFAELYTTIAVLRELEADLPSADPVRAGSYKGRALHRKRYAARRVITALAERMPKVDGPLGPTCILPTATADRGVAVREPTERLAARLLSLLSLSWNVASELIQEELRRMAKGTALGRGPLQMLEAIDPKAARLVPETRRARASERPPRRRRRVDRRRGNGVRSPLTNHR